MTFPLALIIGGMVVVYAGWKRQSIADVLKGVPAPAPSTGQSAGGAPSGGSGSGIAGAVSGGVSAVNSAIGGANPIGKGLTSGRIDQGKDWGGSGPVYAIGSGVVLTANKWNGWPGTGGLVYKITEGPLAGKLIYLEEDVKVMVKAGQRITAGQHIAQATGGGSGIEMGFANKSGTGPLDPYAGRPDGTPTGGGKSFAQLVDSLMRKH